MIYITLDTDAWLKLIHDVDPTYEVGPFDEFMFWIEHGHVKIILPQNIKTEWERGKENIVQSAKQQLITASQTGKELFKNHTALSSFYNPDQYETFVRGRVKKIDDIFENCEIAPTTDDVILKAAKRNLECLAPNHTGDSFRDTINILSLIDHLKQKEYSPCFFITDNYKDFSKNGTKRETLHDHLESDFKEANLEYVYTSRRLIYGKLKQQLPSYSEFLKEERRKTEEATLQERKQNEATKNENTSNEFLDNASFYIDRILSKKNPSTYDKKVLQDLIDSHESYKSYFLKKVGDGNLV
jgi:hypothetical protein